MKKLKIYLRDNPDHILGYGLLFPVSRQFILDKIFRVLSQEKYKHWKIVEYFPGQEVLHPDGSVTPNENRRFKTDEAKLPENRGVLREYVVVYCQER